MKSMIVSSVLAGSAFFLSGCIVGNSPKVIQPTVGQELMSLKQARDNGSITEEEYETTRAQFLVVQPD